MATQTALLQLVIHSKFGGQGFSDKYFLPYTSFSDAATVANRLVRWRAAALTYPGEVCWARMSFVDTPRNTIGCLKAPIPAGAAFTGGSSNPVEDVWTALHFRLETADGHWANRLVRGISDAAVQELKLQPNAVPTWVPYVPGDPLPDPDDPSTPYPNLVLGYMEYVRRNTIWAKLATPGPLFSWEVMPWSKVIFRKIANRQTGVAFGMTRGRARKRAPVG